MKEERDMVAVSVPFALGVFVGTAGSAYMGYTQEYIAAGAAAVTSALFLALFSKSRKAGILPCLLFLTLGIFCSISGDIRGPGISHGGGGPAAFAGRCLEALREVIRSVPFPNGSTNSLISALLTGDRSGLTPEQTAAFRGSGTSHILALSGLHLGMIYLIVSRMLAVIGNTPSARRLRCFVVTAFSGLYTLMTGAGPSIVRAFIFIVINELSRLDPERKGSPVRTLMAALTIQLALRPAVAGNLGFQLSYLAMTGIATLYPSMSSWYPDSGRPGGFHPVRKLWNSTALTVSCQLFTAPLVWIRFRTFPKYFLISNLTALPLTSAVMVLSVVTIALSCAGICPELLILLDDRLVQMLFFLLECVSGM